VNCCERKGLDVGTKYAFYVKCAARHCGRPYLPWCVRRTKKWALAQVCVSAKMQRAVLVGGLLQRGGVCAYPTHLHGSYPLYSIQSESFFEKSIWQGQALELVAVFYVGLTISSPTFIDTSFLIVGL